MKRFIKLMSKCFVVFICTISLCVSALAYDPGEAIKHAEMYWDDGKGLCAEFVFDCLKAGGVSFPTVYRGCGDLFNALREKPEVAVYDITVNADGQTISWSKNKGKIKPGDVLFRKDPTEYGHAVIVGYGKGDLVNYYAHNNPNYRQEYFDKGCRWVCAHFK